MCCSGAIVWRGLPAVSAASALPRPVLLSALHCSSAVCSHSFPPPPNLNWPPPPAGGPVKHEYAATMHMNMGLYSASQ